MILPDGALYVFSDRNGRETGTFQERMGSFWENEPGDCPGILFVNVGRQYVCTRATGHPESPEHKDCHVACGPFGMVYAVWQDGAGSGRVPR